MSGVEIGDGWTGIRLWSSETLFPLIESDW